MEAKSNTVELQIRLYRYDDTLNVAEFIKKKGCLVNFYELSRNIKESLYQITAEE